jgi:two-component system response regulator
MPSSDKLARAAVPTKSPDHVGSEEPHATGLGTQPNPSRTATGAERIVILVVEDDPADRNLIRRAFEDCQDEVELRFAHDGEQAIDYLFRFRPYSSRHHAPRPRLIVLDLNVPRMDGKRIIHEIRQDPVLRVIPIVVLTGSEDAADVLRAYELGANSYFTKPSSMDGYRKVVRMLDAYWLRRAALPPSV